MYLKKFFVVWQKSFIKLFKKSHSYYILKNNIKNLIKNYHNYNNLKNNLMIFKNFKKFEVKYNLVRQIKKFYFLKNFKIKNFLFQTYIKRKKILKTHNKVIQLKNNNFIVTKKKNIKNLSKSIYFKKFKYNRKNTINSNLYKFLIRLNNCNYNPIVLQKNLKLILIKNKNSKKLVLKPLFKKFNKFFKYDNFEDFNKSNQNTYCIHRPIIAPFQWIQKGDLLSDCSSSYKGELALGKNLLVAYMPWEGFNFEDAVLINQKIILKYISLHIEKYDTEITETANGFEEITLNIPNATTKDLKKLDKNGIIKIGSWVNEGDILVGKIVPITPKILTTYEKLLYDIVEEKAPKIKERCLRVPQGVSGRIIKISYISNFTETLQEPKTQIKKNFKYSLKYSPKQFYLNQILLKKKLNKKLKKKNRFKFFNSFRYFCKCEYIRFCFSIYCKKNIKKFNYFFTHNQLKYNNISVTKNKKFFININLRWNLLYKNHLNLFSNFKSYKKLNIYNNLKNKINLNIFHQRKVFLTKTYLQKRNFIIQKKKNQKLSTIFCFFIKKFKYKKNFYKNYSLFNNKFSFKKFPIAIFIKKRNFLSLIYSLNSKLDYFYGYKKFKNQKNTFKKNLSKEKFILLNNKQKNINLLNKLRTFTTSLSTTNTKFNSYTKFVQKISIYIAEKREFKIGDKISGRHGNKGIVSRILSNYDMPYLSNGSTLDILLNPLGVPSRMNVGQVLECLLGFAGKIFNTKFQVLCFDEVYGYEASRSFVYSKLIECCKQTNQKWFFSKQTPGKLYLFDGRTGELFYQPIMVGSTYIMKLIHIVDEKIHARSTGPYSLITQQPLRGRAKQGGQRIGEMEVWALQGYGCAYTLQELLTIKSDDIQGRNQIMQALLKNIPLRFGTPESVRVVLRELQCLCLNLYLSN